MDKYKLDWTPKPRNCLKLNLVFRQPFLISADYEFTAIRKLSYLSDRENSIREAVDQWIRENPNAAASAKAAKLAKMVKPGR